nr:prepilin-type N-terminal cleavage/methylation domain-containing protein [Desulfobulbaceae bacterium]
MYFRNPKSAIQNQKGFSLFELMIAMILLAMVSVMIYSVLNVGIRFSEKGNKRILAMERKYGLVNLLQRQIKSAVYDVKKKEILMSSEDDLFRVVTRNPFIYQYAGVVLALYRYNASESAIYYSEKRDYWNTDYDEDYLPDFDEMILLAMDEESLNIVYDQEVSPEVSFEYRDEAYSLVPRCTDEKALSKLELE